MAEKAAAKKKAAEDGTLPPPKKKPKTCPLTELDTFAEDEDEDGEGEDDEAVPHEDEEDAPLEDEEERWCSLYLCSRLLGLIILILCKVKVTHTFPS